MPIALSPKLHPRANKGLIKFTNCRLVKGDGLVSEDLWVSSVTGTIINSQANFFDELVLPDETIDLGGRIVSPGMIECQLNGAFGFNFSTLLDDMSRYGRKVREINRLLVQTGVTSYLPTITSQRPELYQKALPFLGPSGRNRDSQDGAESLGAHCEGPFLNPTKNGVHDVDVMLEARRFSDIEACYGVENLQSWREDEAIRVKMVTAAPERGQMMKLIPELASRGIIYSIGHSEATYEEASEAISQVKIAFNAHPDGFILVTDAMHLAGLPDGTYPWMNGGQMCSIVKKGSKLLLENSDVIAGSSITLIECVNNFLRWSGASVPQALKSVTSTPAAMLGVQSSKGTLEAGADADLVILSEEKSATGFAPQLVLEEVWKFGSRVFSTGIAEANSYK